MAISLKRLGKMPLGGGNWDFRMVVGGGNDWTWQPPLFRAFLGNLRDWDACSCQYKNAYLLVR